VEVDGRAERGERSAHALLAAAKRGFARHGFRGASVRAIAAAAGVNPALVRYHFGSKAGLYARVIDEAMGGLRERLVGALAGAAGQLAGAGVAGTPAGVEDALGALVNAYLDHLERDRDFPRLVLRALVDREPRILRVAEAHLRPGIGAVAAAVAGAVVGAASGGALPAGALDLAALRDGAVSLFGAAVAPFVYGPLIGAMTGEDALSAPALARRRRHLVLLARAVLAAAAPPSPLAPEPRGPKAEPEPEAEA
jgi:AcrR family transcriptional regulator